jgi:acetyl-CoA carboxylase alpha subunit
MKHFAEIIEIRDDEKSPKSFKSEVKDKKEAIKKLKEKEKKNPWPDLKYIKRFHICRHRETGETENKPCVIQKL